MRLKVYIDTSVIGGCLDDEFKEASTKLIEKFRKGELIGVVGKSNLIDAQYIAIATVEGVDILVSWNFRQIVNAHKISPIRDKKSIGQLVCNVA